MGDPKKTSKYDERRRSSGCCLGIALTLCVLSAIASFGVINYLQFEELWKLKVRVEELESICKNNKRYTHPEEHINVEHIRNKRDVATDSMTQFIANLVKSEVSVLEQYCGNASKICLPGPKGDPGAKGDPGIPGTKGQPGQFGVPGPMGLNGSKGEMGEKGEKGQIGLPGLAGHKGDRGQYGIPGLPGPKGDPGVAGVAGIKGQKGDVGPPLPANQQCCSALSKPNFTNNRTETITAYIGQTVDLPCNSSGYPPPSVTITPSIDPKGKNRYAMTSQGLRIQNVETGDHGLFKCTLDNILGTSEKYIRLLVTDPVVATITPTTFDITEGNQLSITCDVSGDPSPVVTWQHTRPDGQVVPVNAQNLADKSIIVISSAHAADAGTYKCIARNQYENDTATTIVTITGKPQIIDPPKTQTVLEGSNIKLNCGVVSNPPSNVTWTYPLTGDKPPLNALVNPDNSISLTAVDNFNNGVYTCTATNSQGTTTTQATLKVEQGLTVTVTPHTVPMTGTEQVLNFQCQATGTPTPSLLWSKEGAAPLTGNSKYVSLPGGNLIITAVDIKTDTGIYDCTASNHNGNMTDKAIVYRDLGQLSCASDFNQTSCDIGQLCGGKCPVNCVSPGQIVYGFKKYEETSQICVAGQHTGSLPNQDSLVLWQHTGKPATFTAVTSNGIQSSAHAQSPDSYMIISQASKSTPVPMIG